MERPDRTRVIAVWSRKGGNGKTTVASNLAYDLSDMGYRVLAIDSDSQCDMTCTLLPQYTDIKGKDLYQAMARRRDISRYTVETDYEGLDIVPGSAMMEELERTLSTLSHDVAIDALKDCLEDTISDGAYDFIVIDTDKSMGLLNKAILNASDHVIVLAECSFYSVKALLPVTDRIEQVRETNPSLTCLGMVFNKVNSRKLEVKNAMADTREIFPWPVFDAFISNDAAVERSQRECLPLKEYAKNSRANEQMLDLTREVLSKMGIGGGADGEETGD